MFYPKDFKDRVKKVYPYNRKLHKALDQGKEDLGGFFIHCQAVVPAKKILEAQSLEEVQTLAEEALEKRKIYHDYVLICYAEKNKKE